MKGEKGSVMSNLKIFTENIETEAVNQIDTLIKQPVFAHCKVRIMPDVHAGKGCVIGFTADLGDKVIPNIVGVDIGCGMLTSNLGDAEIDLEKLDAVVKKLVPSGRNIHESRVANFDQIEELYCIDYLKNIEKVERSIGTLGGGNHFIELDIDEEGNKYLIIHSGSRNLGKQVADYYQNLAFELLQGKNELSSEQTRIIESYKAAGRANEIEKAIKELHQKFREKGLSIPKELCYLAGKQREQYLHDMKICQDYAALNRETIAEIILSNMKLSAKNQFQTIHNYIDLASNIVRKGAISAKEGELLLIPINMRDGCIIGSGKGNDDWNQSAPHGAGRLMSRSKAREVVKLEDYQNSMIGIYTSSISSATIDEAPMVYKPLEDIVNHIHDTVEILKIIKPIYNYKACE